MLSPSYRTAETALVCIQACAAGSPLWPPAAIFFCAFAIWVSACMRAANSGALIWVSADGIRMGSNNPAIFFSKPEWGEIDETAIIGTPG